MRIFHGAPLPHYAAIRVHNSDTGSLDHFTRSYWTLAGTAHEARQSTQSLSGDRIETIFSSVHCNDSRPPCRGRCGRTRIRDGHTPSMRTPRAPTWPGETFRAQALGGRVQGCSERRSGITGQMLPPSLHWRRGAIAAPRGAGGTRLRRCYWPLQLVFDTDIPQCCQKRGGSKSHQQIWLD